MAWTDVWTSEPAGAGVNVTGISPRGRAHIVVPNPTVALDNTPFLDLEAYESAVFMDGDITDLLTSNGTFRVYYMVGDRTLVNQAVIFATLSFASPFVLNVPRGRIYVQALVASNAVGVIAVQGRGLFK